jgi:hypothetical protein
MFTIILKPILASQAPIVNIINAKIGIFSILDIHRREGINNTRVSIIPSRHRRAISR